MTKNYFAIDPAAAYLKDQAIRGKVFLDYEDEFEIPSHDFGAFFQVALIDPGTYLTGQIVDTADKFIQIVDEICEIGATQNVVPPGHILSEATFSNNYIKGMRVLYEQFQNQPCYNVFNVVFNMSEDNYSFEDEDTIYVKKNCELILHECDIEEFDTAAYIDPIVKKEHGDLLTLAAKMRLNHDIYDSFHAHVQNADHKTIGSYLSYSSGYLLRRKVGHMVSALAEKHADNPEKQLPLIGKSGGSRTQDYLVLAQRKDFFPFTDMTRRPAALFNNIAVLNYCENKEALFDRNQTQLVADYLNQQKSNNRMNFN